MKILITGGTGFIGSNLVYNLCLDHEIYISSRNILSTYVTPRPVKLLFHNDLLDIESFPTNIDVLIHLANLNYLQCEENPSSAIKVNIDDSRIIVDNAIKRGIKKIIYFSTVQVYGNDLTENIDENTKTNSQNLYSITHFAAEDVLFNLATKYNDVSIFIIRLSNSFGIPPTPNVHIWNNFVNNICKQVVSTNKIIVYSNPGIKKDFIPISEVVRCINFLISQKNIKKERFILSSGKTISLNETAEIVKKIFKQDCNLVYLEKYTHMPEYSFNNKVLREMGFKVNCNIKKEISELLDYCKVSYS
jgi:UDP-glucose 4-epimerase